MSHPVPGNDPFEVDHALLHLGGSGALGWGNLGDWSQTHDYATAARALAMRVIDAADVGARSRVVDAGCGWGEQSVLLVRERQAAHVLAIDPSSAHVDRARARVASLGMDARVDVRLGSAARLLGVQDATVDAVIAVDSAYHFDTRADFLREARRVLRPGGHVAWTDLVLGGVPGQHALPRWRRVAKALAVPPENLCPREQYPGSVESLGLELTRSRWLTREVLGGFGRFSLRHGMRHGWRHPRVGWAKILVSGLGALYCDGTGHVEYGLFAARRPALGSPALNVGEIAG